jgi:hypothetical protein
MWLKSDKNYLRFDEKSNTYDSLEKLCLFLSKVQNEPNFWKWSIIALHNSLYGAMILSLQGSNPDRVSKFPIGKKTIYSTSSDNEPITLKVENRKLIDFSEAFKRIQKDKFMKMNVGSNIFKSEFRHQETVRALNNIFRNQFLHFMPLGWSIEIMGLDYLINDCLEIIEFCLLKSGNVMLDEEESKFFKDILYKVKDNNKN